MKFQLYRKDYYSFKAQKKTITYELKDFVEGLEVSCDDTFKRFINGDTLYTKYIGVVEFFTDKELKVYIDKVLKAKTYYKDKEIKPKEPESKRGLELSSHNIDLNSNRVNSYRPLKDLNKTRPRVIEEDKEEGSTNYKYTVLLNLINSTDFKKEFNKAFRYFLIYTPCARSFPKWNIKFFCFMITLNSFFSTSLLKSYRFRLSKDFIEREIKGTSEDSVIVDIINLTISFNSIIYKDLALDLYSKFKG